MSIRIPCVVDPSSDNDGTGACVEITPEIARQIVELATTEESSAVVKDSLTVQPAAPAKSRANCPINADEVFGKDLRVYDKPAAPADDEATMQAMRREIAPYSDEWENIATDLIAAIRRGEVPGLPSPDEHTALKAEVERLRAELNRCVGPLVPKEKLDAAIARAEKAESDYANAYKSDMHHRRELSAASERVAAQYARAEDARAAHAKAMELLRSARKWGDYTGPHYYTDCRHAPHIDCLACSLRLEIDAHIAKYGKDASK